MAGIGLAEVEAAAAAIHGVADHMPLVPSAHLSRVTGVPFYLKLESMQATGAFKLRGAMNALSRLPSGATGVVCASTGNHGRGITFAARRLGLRAVVCMSPMVPRAKIDGIEALGGEVRITGANQADAEAEASRLARDEGLEEVGPFDHPHVIAGQGTIGPELLAALPDLATLIVPLSGGGLAGGVALAVKALKPDVRIIGVTMERGAAMHLSIAAGGPVEVDEVPSFADALGGGIGADNSYTLDLCRRYLDETVLVSEAAIYRALQTVFYEDRLVAEGAAVVGIAAALGGLVGRLKGPTATILTGRNVDMDRFSRVVAGQDIRLGDVTIQGEPYVG